MPSSSSRPPRRRTAGLHVLGIRHHGPGSARAVAAALDEVRPDQVLIEGVPELDRVRDLAGHADMVPPVAGLVYAVDEPRRSMFYPLAVFSPEWVALRWALDRGVPVRFIDLPAVHWLALSPEESGPGEGEETSEPGSSESAVPQRPDPIGELARAAGYDDPERWWEDAVEHRADSGLAAFGLVHDSVALIRPERVPADRETALREAAMRKEVRSALRAGAERIVVVCGAFHAPAVDPASTKVGDDAALLRRLPKVKVDVTWAPWTSGRLANRSGYGAGVAAPGWYHHLYTTWAEQGPDQVVPSWLVRTAHALRAEELDAPPASVVEAARLAEALAAVRARPSVGLSELLDATQTVLCDGSALPLRLVHDSLVIGHELGQVPEVTPRVPLAVDLERLQRRTRLKPSAEVTPVVLDLRRDAGRARSVLLHRLQLLGIDWGQLAEVRSTGTFKEVWDLQWRPELTVAVIEAGARGTTVLSATEATVSERAAAAADLTELGRLIELCLLADLPDSLADVVERLAVRTAQQHDTVALLGTVEPLARTSRYGDVRGVDTERVRAVLREVVARASVGLRPATASLDDDAAATLVSAVAAAHRGIQLLADPQLQRPWGDALTTVAADDGVHGAVSGRVNRMLLDAGALDTEEVARRMSRRLSVAAPAPAAAAWLDGFLTGEAILLLHDQPLLSVIDAWVSEIGDATFEDLLPLLRRTFSRFSGPERQQLGRRVRRLDEAPESDGASRIDLSRGGPVLAEMAHLLGLTPVTADPT